MLKLTPRLTTRSLAPLPRTSSLSRHRIGPIGSSSQPNDSPQEPESTTNNASTSQPLGSTSAPIPHVDGLLSSRALFGSIFALTVLLWSVTRFFSAGQQHSTHSQPNAAASTTTRDAAAAKLLRDRRRLRPDSGGPKQQPAPDSCMGSLSTSSC